MNKQVPIDTKSYGNNKVLASYDNFEPRFVRLYSMTTNHLKQADTIE
jgi:hypothetical protein